MTEYRKGYKVDPKTGLTEPEVRAGLTREQAEAQKRAEGEARPTSDARSSPQQSTVTSPTKKGGHRTAWIIAGSVGGLVLLLIIIGIATGGGSDNNASNGNANAGAASSPPAPPSGPKKASNGDDAKDVHNRAQQFVNEAEACLVALQLAVKDTSSTTAMASNLEDARSLCNKSRDYLATENAHGFSDQSTTLFAAADAAKSATNAGLAYLDTLAPSKLADFRNHAQEANGEFEQGLKDLNARLSELGVAHVKG